MAKKHSGNGNGDARNRTEGLLEQLVTIAGRQDDRLSEMSRHLERIDSTLVRHEEKFASIDKRLAGIDDRLAGIDGRLGHVEIDLASVKAHVASLDEGFDHLRRIAVDESGKRFRALEQRVAALEAAQKQ